jgi:Ca-activated chloride channel family protein
MPDLQLFLGQFHFLRPWWLAALVPLALLAWMWRQLDDPSGQLRAFVAPHLLTHLTVGAEGRSRIRPWHQVTAIAALLAVAAAGPTWRREPSPFQEDSASLMIALEASATMDASDVAPTRIGRARQKVRDIAASRPGARTGLIVYAGTAHLVLPPTEDVAVLTMYAEAISTGLMPAEGDDAAAALTVAEEVLALDPTPGSIVFLTDGIDAGSRPALLEAADRGENEILILAFGTERGGALMTPDGRVRTDGGGAPLTASIDAAGLRELESGGIFVTTQTLDEADIERIGRRVQSHLERVQQLTGDRWSDAGLLLMWPVLLLMLPWFRRGWAIRWRRLSAATAVAIVPLLLLPGARPVAAGQEAPEAEAPAAAAAVETPAGGFIDLWLTRDQQGRRMFERGDFSAAGATFEDPMWRGVAAYRAGDHAGALQSFALVATPDGALNMGNAYVQLRDWDNAIAAYDRALAEREGWTEAADNRALAIALRDAEAEEEEPPPSGGAAPTFDPDEVVFDSEEDEGSEGEVEMSVLSDEQIAEMWLRQLTTSPAQFLRGKFAIQAAMREEAQ